MPRAVYVLALGIFAMVTSEFVVAGLMPQIASGLDVSIPQVGYLITAFAAAMAVGGPVLTVLSMRLRPRTALLSLFAVFLAGNVLAATASGYPTMLLARLVTGAASQAFFGVAVWVCVVLVRPEVRGRAISVVINGLMVGTLLGLPLATVVGEVYGWRAAFWAISALTVAAALCTVRGVPLLARIAGGPLRQELGVFGRPRLWLVLSTSLLVIGATFSAFSFLNPILTGISGFAAGAVPLLLMAYGAATVFGNTIVGRFADRHSLAVLLCGLVLNVLFLAGFAVFAHVGAAAVACMLGIGLVGVTMNPAMGVRVQRAGNIGPLVSTVHGSFITGGIIISSALGGLAIDGFGLRAPLWLGVGLALLGILTLVPDLVRRAAPDPAARLPRPSPAQTPDRRASRPGRGLRLEDLRVALDGKHAHDVPARHAQDAALQPPPDLLRSQGEQARGLGFDVVGLDVEVDAGRVVDGLDGGDQVRYGARQRGELRVSRVRSGGHAEGGRPELRGPGRLLARGVDDDGVDPAAVHGPDRSCHTPEVVDPWPHVAAERRALADYRL